MFTDPDAAYHFARARDEFLLAMQAASLLVSMIHLELGVRHLFKALLAVAGEDRVASG